MRYLYQQLLAFWTLIVVVMVIIGISFTQLTRKTMEDNNYSQLSSYGQSVMNTNEDLQEFFTWQNYTVDQQLSYTLNSLKDVFQSQNVDFLFIRYDKEPVYPVMNSKDLPDLLSEKELEEVSSGKPIKKTLDRNIYNKKETTSYVFSAVTLKETNQFYGVLAISQPAKNLDDSLAMITSNLIKGFLVSSVIALIISYYFAQIQVKKINSMKVATKEIANGNFDIQLPNRDKDEFDELAQGFNKMAGSLKESNEEIDRQEERRRQFMADASHEMRTPLTTIKGLLEGMQYNAIPESQKENAIKLMQNETERLIRLVNENLDYEKIRTNQINIVVKKFSATEAFNSLLTQLEGKASAANDKLELLTTEDIDVYADYDRFVQIMVNIIQNAIQFTKDGTISVNIEKGYLETIVKISDTGIGMDEEQVRNIWERYYKADPSRMSTKYGESGLGLSIVQQLVRLHKGTIDVESQLGEGTTFTITFPDIEIAENNSSSEDDQKK